jgi:hypothetical protein
MKHLKFSQRPFGALPFLLMLIGTSVMLSISIFPVASYAATANTGVYSYAFRQQPADSDFASLALPPEEGAKRISYKLIAVHDGVVQILVIFETYQFGLWTVTGTAIATGDITSYGFAPVGGEAGGFIPDTNPELIPGVVAEINRILGLHGITPSFTISPNPTSGHFQVTSATSFGTDCSYSIVKLATGEEQSIGNLTEGAQVENIDISSLAEGNYKIIIHCNGSSVFETTIVKQ